MFHRFLSLEIDGHFHCVLWTVNVCGRASTKLIRMIHLQYRLVWLFNAHTFFFIVSCLLWCKLTLSHRHKFLNWINKWKPDWSFNLVYYSQVKYQWQPIDWPFTVYLEFISSSNQTQIHRASGIHCRMSIIKQRSKFTTIDFSVFIFFFNFQISFLVAFSNGIYAINRTVKTYQHQMFSPYNSFFIRFLCFQFRYNNRVVVTQKLICISYSYYLFQCPR